MGKPQNRWQERTRNSALCTCADCGHRIIRASMPAALRELDEHRSLVHFSTAAVRRLNGNR